MAEGRASDESSDSYGTFKRHSQSSAVVDTDSTDDEELTDRYLHRTFQKNGISLPKVVELGLTLKVPKHYITIIQVEYPNDPVKQAVEICNKWRNLGLQDANPKGQLQSALREIGKTRIARELTGGTRKRAETIEGLREHHVWCMVKNLTKQQALDLGLNLGFQKEDVDRTLEKEEKPGVGALALFIDWKNDLEESSEAECQTFNDALNSAMQQHSTDILKGQRLDPQHDGRPAGNSLASESRQETVNANKEVIAINHGSTGHGSEEHGTTGGIQPVDDTGSTHSSDRSASPLIAVRPVTEAQSCCWKVMCILSITMWIILLVVLLIVLALAASLAGNKTEYVLISGNDTVIAHLASSWMPAQLNIRLFGDEAACQVNIVSIDCSDTNSVTFNKIFISNATDYVYLAEGSMIAFDSRSVPHESLPYRIHIFDNINDAYQYEESGPLKFPCSPQQCVVFVNNDDRTKYFQIKTSSYYFIRCERDNYDCSELEGWTYNQMSYNFSLAEEFAESSTTVQALKSTPTKFHIRSAFFPSLNEVMKKRCLLSQLKYSSCYSAGEVEQSTYYLVIEYPTWTEEYTIYSVIGIGGWLILTVIMSVPPISILIKKKLKKTELIQCQPS